eukprot:SM000022S07196  [mRNA]  locus=s22:442584:446086:- [translate_table: standard]
MAAPAATAAAAAAAAAPEESRRAAAERDRAGVWAAIDDASAAHSSRLGDLDPWTAWAYKPRTITALCVGAAFLVYESRRSPLHCMSFATYASGALSVEEPSKNTVINVKRGVCATVLVYLGYSLAQAPPTILIRPHPAIWKLVHGVAVVYLIFLTFLLFQSADDARQFLKHLHPDLGVRLEERAYGGDCRIYTPENPTNKFKNVYDTLFDEFVIAHILGWYAKAIMLRNELLLWILSISFEFMEVTFNHMLPNFNECWWDSIILDIFLCNWLGIWAGMKTVQYFDGKTYKWAGLSRQPSFVGKIKRSLSQFTPASWEKDQWDMFSGPWRFLEVLTLVVIVEIVELMAFFLKTELWLPPTNPLNTYRLLIWWLIANPAIREYNQYIQSRNPNKKLGAFCWLSAAICIVELLIAIKFGRGQYHKPMPTWLIIVWSSFVIGLVLFVSGWTLRNYLAVRSGSKPTTKKLN